MGVRTNAETPEDCKAARGFGAEGIGLCRTEHMFFEEKRIPEVRAMILADGETGRRAALDKLLQRLLHHLVAARRRDRGDRARRLGDGHDAAAD